MTVRYRKDGVEVQIRIPDGKESDLLAHIDAHFHPGPRDFTESNRRLVEYDREQRDRKPRGT